MKGNDPTQLGYELTNIQLKYETLDVGSAKETESTNLNGKAFMFEHLTYHKTITVGKNTDSIINESINFPIRTMKVIFMLFCKTHAGGGRDSEKVFQS